MQGAEDNELVPLQTTFDTVWRGFDRDQVMRHLASVDEEVKTLVADRDASGAQVDDLTRRLEAARGDIDELKRKIEKLQKPPMNGADLGERLNRMLELANTEASEIIARAQAAAEHTWTSAEEAATNLRGRYQKMLAELDRQRDEMTAEHKETMEKAHAKAEATTTEAERKRKEMDDAAEARRTEIERHFDQTMSDRRNKLHQELTERETKSKKEAEKRVRDATAEADKRVRDAKAESERRVREATAEIERLQGVRSQVSDRLGTMLELMHDARPLLDRVDGEPAEASTGAEHDQTARLGPVEDQRAHPKPGKLAPGANQTQPCTPTSNNAGGNQQRKPASAQQR